MGLAGQIATRPIRKPLRRMGTAVVPRFELCVVMDQTIGLATDAAAICRVLRVRCAGARRVWRSRDGFDHKVDQG